MPTMTVAQLAQQVAGTVVGDGTRTLTACNTLTEATPEQISLYHNNKYQSDLESTRAACVILAPGTAANIKRAEGLPPLTAIESKNIYYAWQQAMLLLHGQRAHEPVGISPLAAIDSTATLGHNVHVHPFAVIGARVSIGDNVHIYPHVTIMHGSHIGHDTVLYPKVTVHEHCDIGNRCIIGAAAIIGSDGFAYAQANGIHHRMPQPGGLIIEDDVDIGPDSIVERGALKPTRVQRGTKIGASVIIGHNCQIGLANLIISGTCISGSTTTGKYVVIAGQVGIAGHLDIPDFVKIGAQSGVMSNPEPNTEIVGTPAIEANRMKRILIHQMNLPELAKRVKELEKQLTRMSPRDQG